MEYTTPRHELSIWDKPPPNRLTKTMSLIQTAVSFTVMFMRKLQTDVDLRTQAGRNSMTSVFQVHLEATCGHPGNWLAGKAPSLLKRRVEGLIKPLFMAAVMCYRLFSRPYY